MIAMNKASLSFQMLAQARNRVIAARGLQRSHEHAGLSGNGP